MKSFKLPLIMAITFISLLSRGQTTTSGNTYGKAYIGSQMQNPTDPFDLICERAERYFNSLAQGTSVSSTATPEVEQLEEYFERWKNYWKDRSTYPGVKAGGDVLGAKAFMRNLAVNNNFCTTSPANAQSWQTEGPNSSALNNIGIIQAVAFDPNNPNTYYAGSNSGGLFKTVDAGANWVNITNNSIIGAGIIPALGIGAIVVDPNNSNNIIVGTTTGAFGEGFGLGVIKSTDAGASWTVSNMANAPASGLNILTLTYGSAPNTLFASAGSTIYKSNDNGSTWAISTINTNLTYNGILYADCQNTPNSLYPQNPKSQIIDIEQSLSNPNIVYASTDFYPHNGPSKMLVSTDGGLNFNIMNPPLAANKPWDAISIDVTPLDPTAIYCYYLNKPSSTYCDYTGATYVIATSTNQGVTWDIIAQPLRTVFDGGWWAGHYGYWNHCFEMSDLTTNDFLVGATTTYKGTWSGSAYSYNLVTSYYPSTANNTHADIRDIKTRVVGGVEEVISGCDGGVILSGNGGSTWSNINGTGLNCSQFYGISTFQKNANIMAAPQDSWLKLRNANVWAAAPVMYGSQSNTDGEAYWVETDYSDDNVVFASGNNGNISKSTNGGLTFSSIGSPGDWRPGRFYLDPTDHNVLWNCSSKDKNLYKYNNGWTLVHSPVPTSGLPGITPVVAVAVAPSNKNIIFEAHEGPTYVSSSSQKLYKSIDGGANWTDITSGISGFVGDFGIKHILIDPLNEKRIWICFNGSSNVNLRVAYSINGGINWGDASNGLTGLSVNHLTYQNGTDDVIFAATDAGVYRWDVASTTWECFNLGLPNTGVRKVEINYCQNKLYASTYGRGVYSCPLPQVPDFHISSTLVNAINLDVTGIASNTLIIPPYYNQAFVNRVIVDPAVSLKIQGTLNFTGGLPNYPSDLIVSKHSNAVLTGTLSTYCPQLWSGVQVGGDVTKNQNYSGGFAVNQGILQVLNGGTIQNAENAITTATFNSAGNMDWGSMGGLVICANAKFLNNDRDVQFLSYPFINYSRFINCLFETNSTLLGNVIPTGRVSLWQVNNVSFEGSDFRYTAGNVYPYGSRGYGIYSIDAKYSVHDICTSQTNPCLSTKRGTFSDLNVGIETANSNPLQTIMVTNIDFKGNYTDGARLSGMNYVTFVNNKIDVGSAGSNLNTPSGLYLNNCQYYSVQNNSITSTAPIIYNTGIYATQSQAGAHTIYRNTINGLNVGVGAQNNNSGDNNFTDGLKIRCNTFNTNSPNSYDIAMMGDGTVGQNPSVAFFQGQNLALQPLLLVGNKYAASCSNENKWYVDNTYNIKGAYHANHGDGFSKITPQPGCSDPIIVPVNTNVLFNQQHCPDNYAVIQNPSNFNSTIASARSAYTTVNNQYIGLIDGGSTTNLLALVNGNSSPGNLKNSLSSASPYLSDAVLSAYFSKNGVPNGHLKEIHGLNAPVSKAVWQILVGLNLPNGIMQNIAQQQNAKPISERTILQAKVANAAFDLELAYIAKITYYLNDTIPASQDTALNTIRIANFKGADCQYIAGLVAKSNSTLTAADIDLMHGGAANVDGFCNFQKIIIQLNQTVQKIYTLKTNTVLKGEVEAIAYDPTNDAQLQAQALLQKVFGTTYGVLRLTPSVQSGSRLMDANKNDELITTISMENNQFLQLYPNPTSNNLNVLLKGNDNDNKSYQLDIHNALGQLIISKAVESNKLQEINTTDLLNGIYFISLSQNNKLIKETKLVIMK